MNDDVLGTRFYIQSRNSLKIVTNKYFSLTIYINSPAKNYGLHGLFAEDYLEQ